MANPACGQFAVNIELQDQDTALDIGTHRPKMGARQGDAPEDRWLHLERGDGGCGFTPQPPITAQADELMAVRSCNRFIEPRAPTQANM